MTNDDIGQRAAEWVVRRDRGLSDGEHASFASWLASDSRHRRAYAAAAQTWHVVDGVGAVSAASHPAKFTFFAAPFERWRFAAAASILLLLSVSAWRYWWCEPSRTLHTGVGGYERVTLSDGSVASLNTATEVRLRFTRGARELELIRGEAIFNVAHDTTRPFRVKAGLATATAVGTSFAVRLDESRSVTLAVEEGRVLFGDTRSPVPVEAGQLAELEVDRVKVSGNQRSSIERSLAWREGYLILDGQSLADAMVEMNRYHATKLRLGDDALTSLRVGGQFRVSDLQAFVKAIERAFNLEAHQVDSSGDLVLSRQERELE